MNIWLFQTGEPLPIRNGVRKMRMAILADKLLERRHSVFWWASAFEHQRKIMLSKKDQKYDMSEKYIIRALRGCGYQKNVSLARYIDHQIVAFKFQIASKKLPTPDVIVAAMPDHLLAYEAARYAKNNYIPFIVDIRDLWPDIILNRFKKAKLYSIGKIALSLDFARLTFLLKYADSLVAVSRGYLNWGLDKIGRPHSSFDKVFYLGYKNSNSRNTVDVKSNLEIPAWMKGAEHLKMIVFIGTFGFSYELELILEAAQNFHRSGKTDICFVLAGTGEKANLISKISSALPNVLLTGWIGKNEIRTLLNSAYVGLVPCLSVENTVPNKPFEYLSAGLPIISSLQGEMAELVNRYQFGLNYIPGDLDGLCQCIEKISADAKMHYRLSQNALHFFKKFGDADKIYDEYADHIALVAEKFKKSKKISY